MFQKLVEKLTVLPAFVFSAFQLKKPAQKQEQIGA
jgi:hypothetical protein